MTRQLILAKYIKAHQDLTIAEINYIKQALKYYEENFGELEDDFELEVKSAIEVYKNGLA